MSLWLWLPAMGPAAAAVVYEGVHGLLEHPLFVTDDDFRRAQFHEPLEPVVAVDDAAVQVVEVAGGEASAVQLDHRAQFRRQHGKNFEDKPFYPVAAVAEGFDDAEALDGLLAALAGGGLHLFQQRLPHLFQVHFPENVQDGFRAHAGDEAVAEATVEFAESGFGNEHHGSDAVQVVDGRYVVILKLGEILFQVLFYLGDLRLYLIGGVLVGLGKLVAFEGRGFFQSEKSSYLVGGGLAKDSLVLFVGLLLLLAGHFPHLLIYGDDDVLGEVEDALQVAGGEVQQQTQAAGDALAEPDVGYGSGELDVAHALAADAGAGDFHAAAVADDAAEADALVLAAEAFPVLGGAEDSLAEQAVLLRAKGAVVDGFRLGNLAVGPAANLLRRGDGDANSVEAGGYAPRFDPLD